MAEGYCGETQMAKEKDKVVQQPKFVHITGNASMRLSIVLHANG